MKHLTYLLLLALSLPTLADDLVLYPTIPGTGIIDYTQPPTRFNVEQSGSTTTLHPTIPYTSIRDITKPSQVIDNGSIYQTIPGTSIPDYSKRGYVIGR